MLCLIGQGHTNDEIAMQLFVSEGTVKTHVNHVFAKLKPATGPPPSSSPTTTVSFLETGEPRPSLPKCLRPGHSTRLTLAVSSRIGVLPERTSPSSPARGSLADTRPVV